MAISTFDEIKKDKGLVAAINAYFAIGQLPDPSFAGEYEEALGLADLEQCAELYIKGKRFPRS